MNRAEYHADPCETPSLNATTAKVLITQAPIHAWLQHPKLNPNYVRDDDTKFDIGTAAHHLLLEGGAKLVVIDAPDYRAKGAKAEREAILAADNVPIIKRDHTLVVSMVSEALAALNACPDLDGYTRDLSDGDAEHTMLWAEDGVHLRGRLDWLAHDKKCVIDYKTTSTSAQPAKWFKSALEHGADLQAAFYLRLVDRHYPDVTGTKYIWMVQETEQPYCVSFIGASNTILQLGEWKVNKAIDLWKQNLAKYGTGRWPGYDPRVQYAEAPAWSLSEMAADEAINGYRG